MAKRSQNWLICESTKDGEKLPQASENEYQEGSWVSVKDRHPETKPWSYSFELSEKVLVRGEGKYRYPWVAHLKYEPLTGRKEWLNPYGNNNFKITEWMPLDA